MPDRASNVASVAKLMADIDLCMLTTIADGGVFHARPMSNNGEVEFDGDLWFFSNADTRKVREITADPRVSVSFQAPERGLWLALEGRGEIVRDAAKKKQLWLKELERWFEHGPEDESIVLIRIHAERAEHWGSAGDGVVELG
jgi:general stress protein 26